MISAKNIYHTIAYKQMKVYCKGDKAKLKELVQQFVDNRNNPNCTHAPGVALKAKHSIISSFYWTDSPQGFHYWNEIDRVVV